MPDTPIASPERPAYDPSLEVRVERLEDDRNEMKAAINQLGANVAHLGANVSRLDANVTQLGANVSQLNDRVTRVEISIAEIKTLLLATLPHLATKADLAEVRTELISQIAEKPSKTYMWGVLAVLLAAYGCGLAAIAVLR